MAGSEELGLREDTLRVLAAFLKQGEAAGSPIPTPPSSPAQEEPTDFLSRLRRCLPCSLGRGAVPPESPRPCSLPLRPCYGPQPGPATPDFYALVAQRLEELVQEQLRSPPSPGGHPGSFTRGLEFTPGLRASSAAATRLNLRILGSLCACLSSLVFSSGLWGGSFPP
ncbi:bcl-2-like protein 12 isoform X9 [Artibeus jamaicensis]|uniref:bcl-2-like protein 12 isoform X9 n=1 Tax=Artibeus jamaicensis TaxID=9417 RepID=UPI00235A5D7C|nr:bcl-2-like protein 12 isoform X9 [Artibeus jamaicensis]